MPTLSEDEFLGERESLPPVLPCSPWKSIGCRIRVPERATSDWVQNAPMSAGPEVRSPPVIDPLLGPTQQCGNETKRATSSGSASKMNIQASGSRPETGHNVAPKGNRPPIRPPKPSMPAFSKRYSDYSLKYIALMAARNQGINKDGSATSRPRPSNRISHGLRHSNKNSRSDCSHSEEEEDGGEDEEEDQTDSLDDEIDGETASSNLGVLFSDHEYDGDDDWSDCSESDDEGDNDKDDEFDRLDDPRALITHQMGTASLGSSGQIRNYSSSQQTTAVRWLVDKDVGEDAGDLAVKATAATTAASSAQVNRGQNSSNVQVDHVLSPERIRINQAQPHPITSDTAHLLFHQIKTAPSVFNTTVATADLKRKRTVGEEGEEENDELRIRRRSHREE